MKQWQPSVCNPIDVWEMHVGNPSPKIAAVRGKKSVFLIADFPTFDLVSVEEQKV